MASDFLFSLIKNELADIVGEDDITYRKAERIAYSMDSFLVTHKWLDGGLEPPLPDWIVQPESTEEVSQILKLASRHRIPVIPFGGGSGSQGGTTPLYGGIFVDMKKMNRILCIDETSLTVFAETGINGQRLEWALNKKGLTLGHYPASEYCATLGGYISARGAGTLSTKYGKAEEIVLTIEVVLPSGEIIKTLPVPRHACGPDLLQLFVGSEGTLGIITKAKMRLDPLPEIRSWRGYLFKDVKAGLDAGRQIMTRRVRPAVMRLYDENSTNRVVNKVLGFNLAGSCLVVGCDGEKDFVNLEMAKIKEICDTLEGRDLGPELGEHWWKHRYDFYFPGMGPTMLPGMAGTFETTTTFDRIYGLYLAKKNMIENEFKDWGAIYLAHFSHWFPWGVMVYDRFVIQKPPQDPHEYLQLHTEIWARAARTNIQYGGTLNDHHGIGIKLGWLMPEMYGGAFAVLQGIKNSIDPLGIMNPGKLGFRR
jgi:alkyldihydroxyacetonephosphate synthase